MYDTPPARILLNRFLHSSPSCSFKIVIEGTIRSVIRYGELTLSGTKMLDNIMSEATAVSGQ
jgi:hypothetical protein